MRRQAMPLFILALLLILLTLATDNVATTAPAQPQGGWVTLLSEDFEGVFPHAPWHIGRAGDPYLWGQRFCNPHRGG